MYASINYRDRRILWQEVTVLIDHGYPSIVVGDLNYIDGPDEKREGRPFVEDIESREFGDFLHSGGLVDLGFVGPRFTRYNNRNGGARVWERIDSIFVMATWIHCNPAHLIHHLSRIASNYWPLFLTTDYSTFYRSPFRFEKF